MAASVGSEAVGSELGTTAEQGRGRALFLLRHEAGLSAGRSLDLRAGVYEFGPRAEHSSGLGEGSPDQVTFELQVAAGEVILTPQRSDVRLDGQLVTGPTEVMPGQVIGLGSDTFALDDPSVRTYKGQQVRVPVLAPLTTGRGRRGRRRTQEAAETRARQLRRFELDVSAAAAQERRLRHQNIGLPADVESATARDEAIDLRSPHGIAVAQRTESEVFWPAGLARDALSPELQAIVSQRAIVAAPAVVVDPTRELLGLVGPRPATAAVCRHLLATNYASASPAHVRFDSIGSDTDLAGLDTVMLPTTSSAAGHTHLAFSIVDRSKGAPSATAGLALADDPADLGEGCDAILTIDDEGRATFTRAGRSPESVLPLGITVTQGQQLATRIAARLGQSPNFPAVTPPQHPTHLDSQAPSSYEDLSRGAVLISGPNNSVTNKILAGLALDLLGRTPTNGVQMFIVDRSDRALMRLAQLQQVTCYVTLDDPSTLEETLTQLELFLGTEQEQTAVLLINELPSLVSFLNGVGRQDLLDRLRSLISAHDRVQLLVAASSPAETELDEDLLARFSSRLRCDGDGQAQLLTDQSSRSFSLSPLADRDLTQAVSVLLWPKGRKQYDVADCVNVS